MIFSIWDEEMSAHLSFSPFKEEHIETVYEWMQASHIAPFWKLDVTYEAFLHYVQNSLASPHKHLYIGYIDGIPVSYLIVYDLQQDPIQTCYDYQQGDIGIHLLIGPRQLLNAMDGLALVRAMVLFVFQTYTAKRIVGEPDVRNRIVIPILKKLGGCVETVVQLPHKKANIITGKREAFVAYMETCRITVETTAIPMNMLWGEE